jgi:hypothetical protein
MQLVILNNDETEALRMEIGDVNPKKATVAVIQALDTLPALKAPRKIRSDAGKAKTPAPAVS